MVECGRVVIFRCVVALVAVALVHETVRQDDTRATPRPVNRPPPPPTVEAPKQVVLFDVSAFNGWRVYRAPVVVEEVKFNPYEWTTATLIKSRFTKPEKDLWVWRAGVARGPQEVLMCPRDWVAQGLVDIVKGEAGSVRLKGGELRTWSSLLDALTRCGCVVRVSRYCAAQKERYSGIASVRETEPPGGDPRLREMYQRASIIFVEDLFLRPLLGVDEPHCLAAMDKALFVSGWAVATVPRRRTLTPYDDGMHPVAHHATCRYPHAKREWFALLWGKQKTNMPKVVAVVKAVQAMGIPVVSTCGEHCTNETAANLGLVPHDVFAELIARAAFVLAVKAPKFGPTAV
jgi:hypothetical protein